MSIYLGDNKVTGAGVQLDNTLSETSNNAVTNAAITNALEDVGYDTWVKPAEWIDIRSAALKNSIYFLVGHSADYSSYRKFSLTPTISSGTYDVYIDGVKYTTAASDATTTLDWQTLALQTGWDVTYPEALRTHIVRITPTTASSTITHIVHEVIDGQATQGTLWVHFSINNAISVENFCYKNGNSCPLLEAVTTTKGELEVSASLFRSFAHCSNLLELPKIRRNNPSSNTPTSHAFSYCTKLRRLELEDINMTTSFNVFENCNSLKEVKTKNCTLGDSYGGLFYQCYALKRIPDIIASNTAENQIFSSRYMYSLEPTVIDLSANTGIKGVYVQGLSTSSLVRGIKGLIVCNTAPFNGTFSVQIDVSYTGMGRAALVALFQSMPTVTAGQICLIRGATGANDLTAEDLAIATNKGWTVTR